MQPTRFSRTVALLPGVLVQLACYAGTSESPAQPTAPEPPPPPTVGAVVYGNVTSASGHEMQYLGVTVYVLDANCFAPLQDVDGGGLAVPYKDPFTYIARVSTRNQPLDVCLRFVAVAGYTGLFNPPATVVQRTVRLTESGALPDDHGIQFDIEVE